MLRMAVTATKVPEALMVQRGGADTWSRSSSGASTTEGFCRGLKSVKGAQSRGGQVCLTPPPAC